jgi:hypothetical protein
MEGRGTSQVGWAAAYVEERDCWARPPDACAAIATAEAPCGAACCWGPNARAMLRAAGCPPCLCLLLHPELRLLCPVMFLTLQTPEVPLPAVQPAALFEGYPYLLKPASSLSHSPPPALSAHVPVHPRAGRRDRLP